MLYAKLIAAEAPASDAPFACYVHCTFRHMGEGSGGPNVDDESLLQSCAL